MISRKPFKVCKYEQCNGLTRDRYCAVHEHVGQQEDRQRELDRYKDYSMYSRDDEATAFYSNSNWRRVREYVMARDDYLCQQSLLDKRIVKADLVHHIYTLEEYPELAYHPDNLISLSHAQHNRMHNNDGTLTLEGEKWKSRVKEKIGL